MREQSFLGSTVRLRLAIAETDVFVDVPSHRSALDPGASAKVSVVTDQALVAPAGAAPTGAIIAPAETDDVVVR